MYNYTIYRIIHLYNSTFKIKALQFVRLVRYLASNSIAFFFRLSSVIYSLQIAPLFLPRIS